MIVAVRELVELFSEKDAVKVPLPLPLVGLTLSQLTLSDALQLTLEVISKVVEPELLLTLRLLGLTVSSVIIVYVSPLPYG